MGDPQYGTNYPNPQNYGGVVEGSGSGYGNYQTSDQGYSQNYNQSYNQQPSMQQQPQQHPPPSQSWGGNSYGNHSSDQHSQPPNPGYGTNYRHQSSGYPAAPGNDRNRGGFRNQGRDGRGGYDRGDRGGVEVQEDTIYVTGLGEDVTESDLNNFFRQIGLIKIDRKTGNPKIWIYKDRTTGKPKGQATVTFDDPPTAKSAIEWFDGKDLMGKKIKVEMAVRKPRMGGGGGGGGHGGHTGGREGDWRCPNQSCGNNNFGWRGSCNRCGAEKTGGGGDGGRAGGGGFRGGMRGRGGGWGGRGRGGGFGMGRGGERGRGGMGGSMRRGDDRGERRQRPY